MKKTLGWTTLALAIVAATSHAGTADRASTLTYNAKGLIESLNGPRTDVSDITHYAYDGLGRLYTETNALGQVTKYETYDIYGSPGKITDANGVVTLLTYTPEGWLQASTRDAGGINAVTTLTYDAVGNVIQTKDPDAVVMKYTFDSANRLTDVTDGSGNRIHYTLDAAGNRLKEETFDVSGALRRSVSRSFNSLSQILTVTDALNRVVLAFDAADGYDSEGHPVHSSDAAGVQQKKGYDGLNRLVSTINDYSGSGNSTANSQSISSFDASDEVTGIIDPSGLDTVYQHNGLGDLTGIASPDTGTSTFRLDAAGNRVSKIDARGVVTNYTYDALNRPLSASYVDSSLNAAYHYDEANAVTGCPTSAPVGHLTRMVEQAVTTTYCYDRRGNVIQKRQTQGTVTDTLTYSFTPGDRVIAETRPGGSVVRYAYDSLGQVSGVWLTPMGGTEQVVASAVTWLPFGPLQAYALGNEQTVFRTYDLNYRVTDVVSQAIALHFTLDAMGNVTGVTEAAGASATYAYDPLYRLTSVKDVSGNAIEAYTYNLTGDRMSKVAPGAYTGAYNYKPGTHLLTTIGTASRAYDANGNTTGTAAAGTTFGFGYDGRNRRTIAQLAGTTVGSYAYNAINERVAKTAGSMTTRFLYNEQSQLISEMSGASERDYIAIAGVPMAVADGSTLGYITADSLGSPRTVTSAAGALLWAWPYATNPFGENKPLSSAGYVLNSRFPGQYFDAESGLNYNVNRDYEPATGRYIQSDPIGLAGGVTTYSYVANAPLSWVDWLALFDPRAYANYMDQHARGRSQGQCARYVRQGLEAGGANTRGHPVNAKDYGPTLVNNGFTTVDGDGYVPQIGDTAVFQPPGGGNSPGHIETWDGDHWVSDFNQHSFYANHGYEDATHQVYRPPADQQR